MMATVTKDAAVHPFYERIKDGSMSALLLRPELLEHEKSAELKGMLKSTLASNGFELVHSFEAVQTKDPIDRHYNGDSESGVLSKLAESGIKVLLSSMREGIALRDLVDEMLEKGYISKESHEELGQSTEALEKLAGALAYKKSMKEMAGFVESLPERESVEKSLKALGSALPNVEYRSIGKRIEIWILYSKEGNASERLYAMRGPTDPFFASEKSLRGMLREVSRGRSLARNFLDFGIVCQVVHTDPSSESVAEMLRLFQEQGFIGENDLLKMSESIKNIGREG